MRIVTKYTTIYTIMVEGDKTMDEIIQLIWVIDEYTIKLRRLVWLIALMEPMRALAATNPHKKGNFIGVINISIIRGVIFRIVSRVHMEDQVIPSLIGGNHKWHGTRPILVIMANSSIVLGSIDGTVFNVKMDMIIIFDLTDCAIKYLKSASVLIGFNELIVFIGRNSIIIISKDNHMIIQFMVFNDIIVKIEIIRRNMWLLVGVWVVIIILCCSKVLFRHNFRYVYYVTAYLPFQVEGRAICAPFIGCSLLHFIQVLLSSPIIGGYYYILLKLFV